MKSLILLFLFAAGAEAAQLGQIDVDEAVLLKLPRAGAEVVGRVKKSDYVAVSNYPYEGYYKIRTVKGDVGFIDTNDIYIIRDPEVIDKVTRHNKDAPPVRRDGIDLDLTYKPDRDGRISVRGLMQFSLLGGLTLFQWTQLTTSTNVTNYFSGIHLGGEALLPLSESFAFGLRIEGLTKSFQLLDAANNPTHTLSSSAIPVMVGFSWRAIGRTLSDKWHLNVAAFAGASFNTNFSSNDLALSTGNQTLYSATAFTALGKAELAYSFSRHLAGFFEAGWRILTTGSLTANPASVSGNLYLQSAGVTIPLVLDYSGLVLSAGLSFYF